ncbi:alpha-amylase family glycosyl hydrolase [Flavobacterium aciduliphilum]|uniref:Alpha amylase catalytic subunit n=1 Tax=Flavobacterium aciduliphilum TaxID=1101402 RepID=A0A328YJ40_9FLAO|nr:alpha-amylase family glycosyl hydrolase [Flavobacterium aciduliphilum]RAR74081.1 alpha amylase catalytic subunit [Flavobacterium aciduliphilum]
MKKIILVALCVASMGINAQKQTVTKEIALPPVSDKMMENAVIYEANIRQYSPEGTFNAFAKDIPQLKKLGVKILWIMPVHPIGVERRKEGLGSYYSVKDYRGINPEFGTLSDFKNLVKKAHDNGMYVILDWVANHTAWDHEWVRNHPDYYTTDKNGAMVSPFDWTDVVKLNYNNPDMRKAMIDDMAYWLKTAHIDGFRCDVAMEVPVDFWNDAFEQLGKIKPIFKLMEAEQPDLMEKAFDMCYGWEFHHLMNGIAQGKKTVLDIDSYMNNRINKFSPEDITMNFTSNHDENSWNGTEYERLGNAVEAFAALTYLTPGMPLIYNGQEYDFNRRLKFFVKDQITHAKGKMFPIYEKLGALKNSNPALNGGKDAASYRRLNTTADEQFLAFERERDHKKVLYIANLSSEKLAVTIPIEGTFIDYMTGKKLSFKKDAKLEYAPWEYHILLKQ